MLNFNLELAHWSEFGQAPSWRKPMKKLHEIQKVAKSGVPHVHILAMIGGVDFKIMMIRA